MKKLEVAILFGGKSGEHEVSIASAMSVFSALDKQKYNVTLIGIDKSGKWLLPDATQTLAFTKNPELVGLNKKMTSVSLLPFPADKNVILIENAGGSGRSFDVILPILHGTYGEDGTIQGLLELSQIPYLGSGVLSSALAMDKDLAKKILNGAGLPVVPSMTLKAWNFKKNPDEFLKEAERRFEYPYFVKPANMGSSVGVSKVKRLDDALSKIDEAFLYDDKILIEKFIKGRELECSVLGNESPEASIIGEIVPKHEFYSYEAKYIDENGAELNIPAVGLKEELIKNLRSTAIEAFKALECSGLARVDFFYDEVRDKFYINELNTIPGFTKISMYPKLWEATGLKYPDLLDRLISLAIERNQKRQALKTSYTPVSTR